MPASSSKRNRETNDVDVDARSRSRFLAKACVFGCESESAATHVPAFLLKQISARPHLRFFRPRHFDHESSASAGFLKPTSKENHDQAEHCPDCKSQTPA